MTVRTETRCYDLVLPVPASSPAQRHLEREGAPHRPVVVRALSLGLGAGDLLVDVGADVGDRSVPLAIQPGVRVVAYEADAKASEALQATAAGSAVAGRLVVRRARVGAMSGEGVVALDDEDLGGRVDALVVGAGTWEVLAGARSLLARDRPRVLVECRGLRDLEPVAAWMHRHRYVCLAVLEEANDGAPPVLDFRPAESRADGVDPAWALLRSQYEQRERLGAQAQVSAAAPPREVVLPGDRKPEQLVEMATGDAVRGLRQWPADGALDRGRVRSRPVDGWCHVESQLRPGVHRVLWWGPVPLSAWSPGPVATVLDTTGPPSSTELRLQVRMLDAEGVNVGAYQVAPGAGREVEPPPGAVWVQVGLRVQGSGTARARILADPRPSPRPVVGGASSSGGRGVLVVSQQYPDESDPYQNAYVHARVRRYRELGLEVDVLRVAPGRRPGVHVHEGVEVRTGDTSDLELALKRGRHRCVAVHRLDPETWRVLAPGLRGRRLVVWVHGFELQRWQRRAFAHEDAVGLERARMRGEARDRMWPEVVAAAHHHDLHLVFVSHHSAAEARADYDLDLPDGRVHVVPNPIDTSVFTHDPKPAEQRLRILSVRSWRNSIYAGDLSVAAVLDLAREPWFDELDLRFVGDGPLFESTLAPLRGFDNVTLHRGWLTHQGLADLYTQYGVGLMPTRMDSHGVSRDEMMAAGMVPLTTATAAVPEYVDDGVEGFLAPYDDWRALADAVRRLRAEPETFTRMSLAAAARVRRRSATDVVVPAELRLLQP